LKLRVIKTIMIFSCFIVIYALTLLLKNIILMQVKE